MKINMRLPICAVSLGLLFVLPSLNAQQGGLSPLWRQALGGAAIGVPVAQAESVTVVCDGGMVRAYSRTGRLLWSYGARGRLSPYITRSPEGTSYVCRTNGLFIALNRSGRELWRVNLGGPLAAPVLVGWDGRIFVPTANRIACYTASGFLLWSKQLSAPPALPPQPDKLGGLLTVTSDGEILILGPYGRVSARKLGEVPAALVPLDAAAARSLAPGASKAAADAVRALADEAAKLAAEAEAALGRAREAADKAAARAKDAPADAQAAAIRAGETAAAAALDAAEKNRLAVEAARRRPPAFDGNEQTVLAIYKNGRSESIRWYNDGESSFAADFPSLGSAPLGAINREDLIGAALADGRMLLFSVAEGRALWSAGSHIAASDSAPGAAANTRLVYDERGLYALTNSGATGYGTDGKQLWTITFQGAPSPPAFSDDGILYAGGNDWVLYAYHMEDTVKIRKQSLYGPAAEGSYSGGDPRPSPWAEDYNRYEWAVIRDRLETISAAIRKGRVGAAEKSYAAYLMEISGSISQAPANQDRLHPLVHVHHRVEAARLLSYIGSRETIPFLAALCGSDPDPLVKAAAAEAIGFIGVDPDGVAMAAFASLVFPLIPGRDEQVMAAIAAATGALCRFSGPPLSESGARLLTALAGLGPGLAQAVAHRELDSLYY
jgi:outer membrane protein assembly factor BamB